MMNAAGTRRMTGVSPSSAVQAALSPCPRAFHRGVRGKEPSGVPGGVMGRRGTALPGQGDPRGCRSCAHHSVMVGLYPLLRGPARPSGCKSISTLESGSWAVQFSLFSFQQVGCAASDRSSQGSTKGLGSTRSRSLGKMLLPMAVQRQGSRQMAGNLQLTASLMQ